MALTHIVPPDAWDTHIHIFDPESFPYGLPRSYTPKAAALEEYPFQITNCTNILVVQATVQGTDPAPLLDAISENGSGHKRASLRGLTTADLSKLSEAELDRLQSAGVRGVRMHEMSWGHGAQASAHNIAEKIRVTAPIVARLGWVVDVFSDVHTWAALDHFFRKELDSDVRIVADHCGGVFPGDEALPEFKTFISLIQDGYLNIKLSGFERLYHQKEGGMESMKPIIKAIVQAGSKRIVFGSDWPHTQLGVSRIGKTDDERLTDIEEFREVPNEMHIRKLREWIEDEESWLNLWCDNPRRLFG